MHVHRGEASHEHSYLIDPDHRILNWWPHNSVSPGVCHHLAAVNPLIITSMYGRLNEQVRQSAATKWALNTRSHFRHALYCSKIDAVSRSQDFPCSVICRRYTIVYDKGREDCMSIPEAPRPDISHPQSNDIPPLFSHVP